MGMNYCSVYVCVCVCACVGCGVTSHSEAVSDREHHAAASHGCVHPSLLHSALCSGEKETGTAG